MLLSSSFQMNKTIEYFVATQLEQDYFTDTHKKHNICAIERNRQFPQIKDAV